jgi:hypothetical protein
MSVSLPLCNPALIASLPDDHSSPAFKGMGFSGHANKTGFVKTSFGNANQSYEGLARTSDNKFIAVGQTGLESVAVVARYLSNGVLDAESNWNLKNYRESNNINKISIGLLG